MAKHTLTIEEIDKLCSENNVNTLYIQAKHIQKAKRDKLFENTQNYYTRCINESLSLAEQLRYLEYIGIIRTVKRHLAHTRGAERNEHRIHFETITH